MGRRCVALYDDDGEFIASAQVDDDITPEALENIRQACLGFRKVLAHDATDQDRYEFEQAVNTRLAQQGGPDGQ